MNSNKVNKEAGEEKTLSSHLHFLVYSFYRFFFIYYRYFLFLGGFALHNALVDLITNELCTTERGQKQKKENKENPLQNTAARGVFVLIRYSYGGCACIAPPQKNKKPFPRF